MEEDVGNPSKAENDDIHDMADVELFLIREKLDKKWILPSPKARANFF